ncbi:MAG: SpoVR family protein [Thermaerobacter sp.]|nr:SpoVR family protein [Thermaerobacter sp.]
MSHMEEVLSKFLPAAYEAMAALGLDPVPIDFEIVPADAIYELASYGLPGHYGHWTFGRDYWRMKRQFEAGAGRLYEMIIETSPPVAYLLESNTMAAQKLVVAHCLGHADVFRHHVLAAQGGGQFHQTLAAAADRFAGYRTEYGALAVEVVLDRAMAIQGQVAVEPELTDANPATSGPVDAYADLWAKPARADPPARPPRYRLPTADLLGFLARESPVLTAWERDICDVVRMEGLYHRPKRQIKIIHEGWATFCHQALLPQLPLSPGEQIEAARIHAQVARPDPLSLNPYWFGWRFLQGLVEDYGLLPARSRMMQESDASLVRNYLTPERVRALDLYHYRWNQGYVTTPQGGRAVWNAERQDDDPRELRDLLANALAERPPEVVVEMVDGDDRLVLRHSEDGTALDPEWAQLTLDGIRQLWGHPVLLHDGESLYVAQ